MDAIKQLIQYKELIINLVVRNLKIRYKNSFLGFFWTLLNPIFFILIYFVFIKLMRFQMNIAGLLAGVIPWHFLSMTLGDSIDSISGNHSLITKVKFPRIILPLSTVVSNSINYILSLFVLILFLPVLGSSFSIKLLLLLPLFLLTFVFVLGLSLFLATCNVYFKDTPHILSVFMMAWFFMTPIIYPFSQIPEKFREIAYLNPMTVLIDFYRFSMQGESFVYSSWMIFGILIIALVFFIGKYVFSRFEPTFADEM